MPRATERPQLGRGSDEESMMRHGWVRVMAVVLWGAAGCSTDEAGSDDRHGSLRGQVVLAGPVRGAKVSIDQLYLDNNTGDVRQHVADLVTDDEGRWELPNTGLLNGLILVTAAGGAYRDNVSGAEIELDDDAQIRSLFDVDLYEERFLLVSPVGHLAESLARARLAAGQEPNLWDAREVAAEHIDRHFGGVDWARIELADIALPATSPTEEIRAAAVHAAWPVLVEDIRLASGATPQEVHVFALMTALAKDIARPPFDGEDQDSRVTASGLQLGVCDPVPTDCIVPGGDCGAACRSLCDLYSGTLRADFSGAMTKMLRAPTLNGTGLVDELVPVARAMASNQDEVLFGATCTGGLDRLPPTITWTTAHDDGAFVAGAIDVEVRADDDLDPEPRISWVGFEDADQDATNKVARLSLANGALIDGPFTLTAVAADQAGNRAESSRTWIVDGTPPALTLASDTFVVVGSTWWTTSATPSLRGLAADANGVTLTATINGTAVEVLTEGETWTVAVPRDALQPGAGNTVIVTATDPAGNSRSVNQVLGYDAAPPVLSPVGTQVRDERGDTIGPGPVHTHAGQPIALGAHGPGTCQPTGGEGPHVYRHAYLMVPSTSHEPDDQRNHLRWTFQLEDVLGIGVRPESGQYRLRAAGGEWSAWRAVSAPTSPREGVYAYHVTLLRGDHPQLGTTEGVFEIEFHGADLLGREVSLARCWTHHPLAPPLQLVRQGTAEPNTIETGPLNALKALTLSANSAVSPLLNAQQNPPAGVMFAEFANNTSEAVYLTVGATGATTGATETDWVESWAPLGAPRVVDKTCNCTAESEQSLCGLPSHTVVDRAAGGGATLPAMNVRYRMFVHSTGPWTEVPSLDGSGTRFRVPPRFSSGPAYAVIVVATPGAERLRPSSGGTGFSVSEQSLSWLGGASHFTGQLLETDTLCTKRVRRTGSCSNGRVPKKCIEEQSFRRYRAVTKLDYGFTDRLRLGVHSAATSDLPPAPIIGVAAEAIGIDRFNWTTTEAGLPPAPTWETIP
jgi:hypothetical protein